MTFFKRLIYYLRFWAKGRRQMFRALDNEANLYYNRCDLLPTKYRATIFTLMVANISCEIYEQMIYGLRHKFKDELFDLDALKAMYRVNIMYFYIKLAYDYPSDWESLKPQDFAEVSKLRPKEKKLLQRFLFMIDLNPDLFELEFLKYYSKAVFKQKVMTPYTVALSGNILYNSYEGFLEDFSMYIKRDKIA
ncbi:MAG: hypothetical protein FWE24_07515 [Defluviitaleaceae bacterium]|nr:hypothetical protein [Defluviitaleaceae bacterium]